MEEGDGEMMRCPKCNFSVTIKFKDVYARKPNGGVVLIYLAYCSCNRRGCDWKYKDDYNSLIESMGLKPY